MFYSIFLTTLAYARSRPCNGGEAAKACVVVFWQEIFIAESLQKLRWKSLGSATIFHMESSVERIKAKRLEIWSSCYLNQVDSWAATSKRSKVSVFE